MTNASSPSTHAYEYEGTANDHPESTLLLTSRQIEVVRLACLGLTAKETARRLGISKNTVDEHLREARRRVGASTKSRLVGWAVAAGIVPAQDLPRA